MNSTSINLPGTCLSWIPITVRPSGWFHVGDLTSSDLLALAIGVVPPLDRSALISKIGDMSRLLKP